MSVMLVFTACLTSCNNSESPDSESPEDDTTVYTCIHSYMPEETYAKIKELFETNKSGGTEYWTGGAPYVFSDVFGLSDSKLLSVSIPVMGTGKADENGDFIFTISVYKNDLESLSNSAPASVYPIAVSGKEYGLEENASGIYKFITVDLSEYDIVLAEDETIAVSSKTDTLLPAYLAQDDNNENPIYNVLKTEFPQLLSFSIMAGSQTYDAGTNSLLFNFTFERSYVGKSDYDPERKAARFQEMLDAVASEYAGMKLSVFGDSISTYENISNNPSYNSTIGSNEVWYNNDSIREALLYDYTYTYWGSLIREAGMELCVNNSWSGDGFGSGRYLTRAQQLHNNKGENPDLIVVYFGINDTWGEGMNVGNLLTLLENKGEKNPEEVIGKWLEDTLAKSGLTNWDEMYAKMLTLMKEKYPEAKIVCIDLVENGGKADYPSADKWVPLYNEVILALGEYFDIPVVHQHNVIDSDNYHSYTHDLRYMHPNAYGHRVIFEELVRTLYADLQNN